MRMRLVAAVHPLAHAVHSRFAAPALAPVPDAPRSHAQVAAASAPREEAGLYWGFATRLAKGISGLVRECPFEGGYDLKLGVSEHGQVRALSAVCDCWAAWCVGAGFALCASAPLRGATTSSWESASTARCVFGWVWLGVRAGACWGFACYHLGVVCGSHQHI